MMKIEQREGEAGEKEKKDVEEVLRLCTYIRGERGWGEINESGLAMQAFLQAFHQQEASGGTGAWQVHWPGRHGRPSRRRNHRAARSVGELQLQLQQHSRQRQQLESSSK